MRKNILILGHSYGMQFIESCNQYTHLFDKNAYNVTVAYLVGAHDSQIVKKTAAENVVFLACSRRDIRGLKLSAIKKLLTLCRSQSFEVVICHRYKPTYVMLWVAQLCHIPALFFVMHAIGTMQARARRLLIAALLKPTMTFAGVSDAVRDDLRRHLWRVPAQRITTLHNIIDVDLFEPQLVERCEARSSLSVKENVFLFGHVGRLVKEKDQATLLEAFALAKPQCPEAMLIIIGDGRLEEALKQQAEALNIHHHVIFTGFIPDGFRFMKAFDTLVLCSVKEAFGRVLLEAMVARIPVVATAVCGIPEVVGDSGFLVPPQQPHALANQLVALYQQSAAERARYGEKGYQRMLTHFSIEPFKKHFATLL